MGTEEPPGRCFPARCGAAWGGYGAAWAAWGAPSRCPGTVRAGNSAFRVFTKQETRDTRPGYCHARGASQREFRGFHESRNTRHETRPFFETRLLRPFGSPWVREGWRHKKLPSGPLLPPESHCFPVHHCSLLFAIVRHCSPKNIVLRQSPRAARSLLSCALWRGMGRLWRGMGGMGRPEPLSAHRPRRQQRLSGFHETRDPRHETRLLPGARRKPARIPRFSRNTNHESRLFFETRPFCRVGRPLMREGGRPAGFKGGCTKRCVNEWKGVFLNPETGITTFTESRLGSRPGISHNIPLCVGKIRISPCRPSSASAHCGNRDIGFMDVSSRRITSLGPQVSPSGGVKGERATNRETQPLTRSEAQAGPNSEVFKKHETRDTNHDFLSKHGFDGRSDRHGSGRVASRKTAARSLLSCALWRGKGRLWRGMGCPEQLSAHHQHQQQGHSGFYETRDPRPETRLLPGARRKPARIPRFSRNTNHESRITAFMLFTNHETRNTNHGLLSRASAVGW